MARWREGLSDDDKRAAAHRIAIIVDGVQADVDGDLPQRRGLRVCRPPARETVGPGVSLHAESGPANLSLVDATIDRTKGD